MSEQLPPVIEAPKWLKDRMEAIKKMPPPTLEEVQRQFEASREQSSDWNWRKRYGPIVR